MSARVTFWGVRGSVPTPGPATLRYGGNTSCVAVDGGNGHLVVLDAGSGIRVLGHELMRADPERPRRVDLLVTHTHWDHIQGLPFFKPLSVAANTVRIHGAAQEGVALEDILGRQMAPAVFPVPLRAFAADLTVREIGEGTFGIEGYTVTAVRLCHPGTTLGFILEPSGGGRKLAYITDNELGGNGMHGTPAGWRARLVEAIRDADVLVHDAMYAEHMIQARAGWGHSTPQQAMALAVEAGCRELVLFHHEPEHDDAALDRVGEMARAHARALGVALPVRVAREGDGFDL